MKLGIVGGSGLYDLPELTNVKEERFNTPFGQPSDAYVCGTIGENELVFLPRHGKGHRLLPTEIPFRANIFGMKKLGVTHLLSVGAVGSLQESIEPGHLVLVDQFIDLTRHRNNTFFGGGIVAHAQFGDPVCAQFRQQLKEAGDRVGATMHQGGTYVCMEGPLFSSRAESMIYRSWGASVIGMTNAQEAKLAREAEMSYACLALATDYDCWHQSEEEVTIEQILTVMRNNIGMSRKLIVDLAQTLPNDYVNTQENAMQFSIITDPSMIPEQVKKDLKPLIGKYLQ